MPLHRQVDVCTHVVSDRLYLIDNLLCLLSNAVKYSDRGATIDVYIEIATEGRIMNPTMTPVKNAIHAASEVDLAIKSYASRNHSYPPMGRKGSSDLSITGSLNGSFEIHSKAKAYSQEIQALFGISGVLPNPNPGRLKKETSARLLLDEPLPEATRSAMLVVRVVDSGIGLSGIT